MSQESAPPRPDPAKYQQRLDEAVRFLADRWGRAPRTGMVLGSGLGDFVESLPDRQTIPYAEVPHFPVSTVIGHSARLNLAQGPAGHFCALQGRVHFYEGVHPSDVVFPVRCLAHWGVERFVITNAAGAINDDFQVGELMLITDHINLLGDNPLCGPNLDFLGERFPDMTHPYDPALIRIAAECAESLQIETRQGVYVAVRGPSYETPAEIRMCRTLGADAVGMSTVPEVIALNHMKRRVLGISCLTNMAAGIADEAMDHQDVLQVTQKVKGDFQRLLLCFLERSGESSLAAIEPRP